MWVPSWEHKGSDKTNTMQWSICSYQVSSNKKLHCATHAHHRKTNLRWNCKQHTVICNLIYTVKCKYCNLNHVSSIWFKNLYFQCCNSCGPNCCATDSQIVCSTKDYDNTISSRWCLSDGLCRLYMLYFHWQIIK